MTTIKEQTQLIVTVLLPNHSDQQHTYDFLPGNPLTEVMEKFVSIEGQMERTLSEQHPLVLNNPMIVYPATHILGIKITIVGPEELRKAVEDQQRHAGFIKS